MGLIIYLKRLKASVRRRHKPVKEVSMTQCINCGIKVAQNEGDCVICGKPIHPYSVESLTKEENKKREEEEE